MKISFSVLGLMALSSALFLATSTHAATIPWVDNNVDWGTNYYRAGVSTGLTGPYDGMPNDAGATSPAWESGGSGGVATLNPGGGYLNIATTGNQSRSFKQNNNWNASVAMTVEFEFRINSLAPGALYAGSVTVGNSVLFFDFLLGVHTATGQLIAGNSQVVTLDVLASEFNTIRLTMEEINNVMTLKAYLNGSETPFQTSNTSIKSAYNNLRFGDASIGTAVSGDMDWKSVKWKSGVAIAPQPIPEPTATGLGGIALGVFLLNGYTRLRRKSVGR